MPLNLLVTQKSVIINETDQLRHLIFRYGRKLDMVQFRIVATAALIFTFFAGAAMAQQGSRYIVQFKDSVRGKAALVAAGATIVKELAPQNV